MLGLVFSEVCIPLTPQCLRAPLLYSVGLVVLRDHTNYVCGVATTVYRREQDSRRFGWKLDSEDGGERSGRGFALRGLTGDPLARGEGLELSPELPDRELDPPLWHHGPFMLYPNCSNITLSFIITQARSYINTIYLFYNPCGMISSK